MHELFSIIPASIHIFCHITITDTAIDCCRCHAIVHSFCKQRIYVKYTLCMCKQIIGFFNALCPKQRHMGSIGKRCLVPAFPYNFQRYVQLCNIRKHLMASCIAHIFIHKIQIIHQNRQFLHTVVAFLQLLHIFVFQRFQHQQSVIMAPAIIIRKIIKAVHIRLQFFAPHGIALQKSAVIILPVFPRYHGLYLLSGTSASLALMFLFLSAMFVIVTSDNLEWLFCGWEITTVCSFLMIGYTRTPEAIKNAFTQIILNMLGGIAFLAGLMFLHVNGMPLTISGVIELSGAGTAQSALMVMPVILLSLAALTKAAQMPFHTWLLGAMVAPTPTSALLHSSTMVKAGVFLMVKLSPLYAIYPVTGFMVTSVGAITFLLAALMAISQSNAKRVLAYSTISNLGLISACLGVGAPEAVWAAIFLILFHTVAKSLLFLCVGTAEHHIGSRNIEDMDGMFSRMPHLTRLMMLGIMGMFVAPFGMLVSKWGALVAFAQTGNVLMIMVLAFGSAATFYFWGKWLAKLSGVDPTAQNVEVNVHKTEWMALNTIAALLILCCVAFPVISSGLVSPYLAMVFGRVPYVIGKDAMYLMVVIVAFIAVVLLTSFRVSNKPHVNVYLSGVGTDNYRHFRGSMGREVKAEKRNWYSEDALGEKRIGPAGSVVCCSIILFALLCCAWIGPERLAMSAPSVLRGKYFEGSGVVGIFIGTVVFALLAPLVGGLIDGIDRKLSARMQGRVGPRLLQPFYDVAKLLRKAPASVNTMDDTYMACALIFTVVGGGIFVSGSNTLLCAFMVTLAAIFVVLASASTQSPFAQVGADRELLQVMSYEPAVLLMSVGLYLATDSFDSIAVTGQATPIIVYSAPIFLALLAVLTIKLRKSPFDLSYSHHAHQEIVQGVATEMSGGTLAKMTLMHWCETVLFLMWVGMFFVWDNPVSWVVALVVMAATYFVEVLIDNTFARSTWRSCFKLGWGVALVFGLLNLMPILVDVFI